MRFRDFMELQGLYGTPQSTGGVNLIQKILKKPVQNPFGKGNTSRLIKGGVNSVKPARPAGMTAPNKPMTISSILK